MTAGTNQPATWSASRWIGARERCASATICTICASMRVAADLVGAHDEAAGLVERAGDHLGAGFLGDRHGFAGHHRFVERRAAFDHDAVDRHLFARAARAAGRRPRGCRAATSSSVPSSPIRRAVFGARSSSALIAPEVCFARAQLQHLAEQHQHGDDGGGLEIDRDRAAMAAEGRREDVRARRCRRRCRRRRRRCPSRSA